MTNILGPSIRREGDRCISCDMKIDALSAVM